MVTPHTLRCGPLQGPSTPVVPAALATKLEMESGTCKQVIQLLAPGCMRERTGKGGSHVSGPRHVIGAVSKREFGGGAGDSSGSDAYFPVDSVSVLSAGTAPRCRCLLAQLVGSSGLEAREQKVFNNCFVLSPGHEVHQTVYMINREKEGFSFAFRESSLFSEGCKTSVKVEPLKGCVAALSR